MGRDRGAAPRARRRPSRLFSRGDAGVPPLVQLHAGSRRARQTFSWSRSSCSTTWPWTGSSGGRSRDTARRPTREPFSRWRDSGDAETPDGGPSWTGRRTRSRPRTFEPPTTPQRRPDHDASRLPQRALEPTSTGGSVSEALDAIVDLLAEAGLVPERPRALLEGTAPQPSRLTRLRPLMEHVRDTDDNAYFARSREMAFLANTLMAGCSVQSRPFTAQEASDAVVGICNLGLEHWPARWPGAETRDAARQHRRPILARRCLRPFWWITTS